jgi:YfiH family protein
LTAEARVAGSAVPRSELAEWRERYGLVAGLTERPFDVGLSTRAPVGEVMGRWRAFRESFHPAFQAVQKSHQVHGNTVLWHETVAPGWHEAGPADGHATSQSGLLLCVTVADCIPIYLAARGRAVALLHAGWRGIAAGVLEAGLRKLVDHANVTPPDVVMHCGVGICGPCYEVGDEVARAVLGPSAPSGHQRLDLRRALADQAKRLGVGQVTISPLCTSCHHDRFYSHRASGGSDGRMVAYLGMPLAPPE